MNARFTVTLSLVLFIMGPAWGQIRSEQDALPVDRTPLADQTRIPRSTTELLEDGGERITIELSDSWILIDLSPIWEQGEKTSDDEIPVGLEQKMVLRIDKWTGQMRLLENDPDGNTRFTPLNTPEAFKNESSDKLTIEHQSDGSELLTAKLEGSLFTIHLNPIWVHGERTSQDEAPVGFEPAIALQADGKTGQMRFLNKYRGIDAQSQSKSVQNETEGASHILNDGGITPLSCNASSCGGQCCMWLTKTQICFSCVCCNASEGCRPAGHGCFDIAS